MKGRIEEVARAIAGEHPSRAIAAMRSRREADEQDAGADVAEARHRPRPVVEIAIARDLLATDPLAPLDEPRAGSAGDELAVQRGQVGLSRPTTISLAQATVRWSARRLT